MAEVTIKDGALTVLKDKVVIVTGSSSGIGLSTVQLLLTLGSSVIGADLQPPPEEGDPTSSSSSSSSSRFTFCRASVTEWADLVSVFKKAVSLHGRVDHVFANAGIGPRTNYVSGLELDEAGDPLEPSSVVLDVNLKGAINTAALAVHYIRRNNPDQEPAGGGSCGSVVINSSITGLQRFRAVDYSISKHGAIGLTRGLHAATTSQNIPVRVNGVAPSWTGTGMVSAAFFATRLHVATQSSDAVARAAALLMADESRRGNLLLVARGVCREVDEAVFAEDGDGDGDGKGEDEVFGLAMAVEAKFRGAKGEGERAVAAAAMKS